MKQSLGILLFFILLITNALGQTITTNGFTFNPDTLYVTDGDTINFNISNSHNAVEVDEVTFLANGNTSNGGFNIPFGGGSWIADSIQTYYYVCQPHAAMGMKGVIISSCNKSAAQTTIGFNPATVYSAGVWSYDTLTFANTSNCDIRLRAEFNISKNNGTISQGDLTIKAWNPIGNNWHNITYSIQGNGDAKGYLTLSSGDTTGTNIQSGGSFSLPIKVKFWGGAQGSYCATWETKEVDNLGNIMQNLTSGNTCLDFVNCNNFAVDSSYSENIDCWGYANGTASIFSIQNGSNNYLYNWSSGDTTSTITNLNPGNYYCIVTDKNWQACSDSIGFSIIEPSEIIIGLTATDLTTTGANDGTITASVSGGIPGYTYDWTGPNGYNNTAGPTNISGLAPGVYMLTITDASSCSVNSFEVVNDPGCDLIITSNYTHPLCFQDSGSITWANSNGIEPYFNELIDSTGTIVYAGNSLSMLVLVSGGAYDLIITDSAGCNEILNIVLNEPTPLLINVWIDASNLVATAGFTTYQWYTSSGALIPGATSDTFTPSSIGEYYVVVTDGNCEETSSMINYNISGLNDLDRNIKIYPNPTNGLLAIEGVNPIKNITVLNTIGNQLLKVENNNNEVGLTKLDLSTFTKGIYFIQIEQNSQIMNYRIILQ